MKQIFIETDVLFLDDLGEKSNKRKIKIMKKIRMEKEKRDNQTEKIHSHDKM
jgi:hypothetical protein